MRGLAALQAAPASSSPQFFYEDATLHLVDALRAGAGVEVYFEASRAARRIPDPDKALALARQGAEQLESMDPAPLLSPHPARTWAEAAFDTRVLAAEIDSERVSHAVLEHLAPLANQIEDEDSGLQDALANLLLSPQ